MESPFQGGLDDTPLVVVEVFGVWSRNLERVGCGDFIVAFVTVVVLLVMFLNSWFHDMFSDIVDLCSFLLEMGGEEVILLAKWRKVLAPLRAR